MLLAAPPAAWAGSANGLPPAPLAPRSEAPRLSERRVVALVLAEPKVRGWLERYPPRPTTDGSFDRETRTWTVRVWSGRAGQVAEGGVDDGTATVEYVRTGPQVAWKMARGSDSAFGGRSINRPAVWLALCVAFLVGLADFRRPVSLRNLDLLALLSFSISLWFFNRGEIFTSVPLAYPPLVYLAARLTWTGFRGRRTSGGPVWPTWALVGATVFLLGFRVGLNVQASNVIDVGYSGVIGAQRIASGQSPYGHFPTDDGRPCGPSRDASEPRDFLQVDGRCEAANGRGDTYGPVAYEAYLPGYALFGWDGRWEGTTGAKHLPAVHFTTLLWDALCLLGLALVGLRFGGVRVAAVLAFAWAAYPFTQYASSSNTNDAIMPALLLLGFWLLTVPAARGAFLALAGWTKFAALLLVPLWWRYGRDGIRPAGRAAFAAGFAAATLVAFSVLLLEPSPLHAARVLAERTVGWQIDRESPFSLWGWGQYHAAGIPDLGWLQRILEVALVVAALALAWVPRRLTPLRLAALTGAVLVGFQLVLTHWFYLYIPWFFPFVAVALLAPAARPATAPAPSDSPAHESRELVAAG